MQVVKEIDNKKKKNKNNSVCRVTDIGICKHLGVGIPSGVLVFKFMPQANKIRTF